ncbi:hypothetical protein QM294_10660 [Acinetobacter junii]|uniref:hypothetical protein n=1 Tax=Acinetobacter junii TaxID=40215 RepID=UPI0024B648E4|nr:hypothetical protein [Acinetobacter junii]MDI9721252.1 hypothetical protein [Acinetobacter junii]
MNKNSEMCPPLMRNRKFLKIIQNILSVGDELMDSLSKEYADELVIIRKIFTEASFQYNRWHTKLCFELPVDLLNNYMASDDSSLVLANYYRKNSLNVMNRIKLRMKIQEDLYDVMPVSEKKKYGYLLKINKNNSEQNTPDIYLLNFFNHIESSFNRFYLNTEKELYEDYGLLKMEFHQIIKLSKYSYETVRENISRKVVDSHYKGSLASKILVNSALNRCILEIDELAHLHCDAYEFLFPILSMIKDYNYTIEKEDDIFDHIYIILCKIGILGEENQIDSIKLMKRTTKCLDDLCQLHSNTIPSSYKDRKKMHFTLEGKFLMALTISLLNYKKYRIDLKAVSINHTKSYEIFNKNTKMEGAFHFPIQVLINRIYHLLFYSGQYENISIQEFARYNLAIMEKRNFLRKLMIEMKELNLEQFSNLLRPKA